MSVFRIIVERTTVETLMVDLPASSQAAAGEIARGIAGGRLYAKGAWLRVSQVGKIADVSPIREDH